MTECVTLNDPPTVKMLGKSVFMLSNLVRVEGLEPPRLAAPEPKSGASTNFATPAFKIQIVFHIPISKGYSGFESKNEFFKKILF